MELRLQVAILPLGRVIRCCGQHQEWKRKLNPSDTEYGRVLPSHRLQNAAWLAQAARAVCGGIKSKILRIFKN